ncbi:hypothetical protein B0T22DRAFT_540446 [Podospora appendiculata]|uniref:Phospholipase/carboxylesterase/thioesterase domain-containing protein n=1 Tax=Podospora appendiculata TaxID=314037 RepID=A0AAE0WYX3_9PEZI|nr:hypothetical protein B0T22DRAFT_540446 [Podospora appendiculata]
MPKILLRRVITPDPSAEHTHTIIFLHGRDMGRLKRAQPLQAVPVREMGLPWCKKRYSDHEELQAKGLRESVVNIRNIIKPEARILGGRWGRVILAVIGQGGATSVHTLLNLAVSSDSPRRLGALMAFCCRMPFPGRTLAETRAAVGLVDTDEMPADDEIIRNTPVLLQHIETTIA